MICYTRNFEDIILQRVFADIENGTYIDVGASVPIDDSNSYALYQKGWRGIAIEPQPFLELWQQSRPEDLLLIAAAGSQSGKLTLHIFDNATQISSGSAETIAHWQKHGIMPSRDIEVPILTLNQVIATHMPENILHLLLIDVEGMEFQVLKGLDLTLHRPWVLVLEATVPGTPWPSHQEWEPYLLTAGYIMAYFDGVNRFYLAQEHRHLLKHFALPPNIWDKFVMHNELRLQAEIDHLKKQLANNS